MVRARATSWSITCQTRNAGARVAVEGLESRIVCTTTPVLFVPGFAASTPKLADLTTFVFNRGQSPTALDLATVYQPLVHAFEADGYVEGRTFFGATFDW